MTFFKWLKNKSKDESGVIGGIIAGAIWGAAIGVGAIVATTAGAIIVGAIVGAAIGYLVEEVFVDLLTPDIPEFNMSPTYASDKIGNTISEGVFVARCYGKPKIGGNKIRFNAADATDLRIIVAHCMGEVEGITRWEVNDIEWSALTGTHTKTEYKGTRTQTVDARFSDRASAYRSIAYTAFTFAKDDKQVGWNPNITVVMEGLKGLPLAGGPIAFTRNPAVILYDWYLNVEGYVAGDLDLNAFKSLEDLCDAVPSGSSLPRYRFDFNIDVNLAINDAKKLIWSSFNGRTIMSQGKIKPIWDSGQMADGAGGLTAKTVSHAFDMDNIVKDSFTWSQLERPNIVRIHFKDSAKNYKNSSVELKDEADIAVNGEILYEEKCWYITDAELARRRCRLKYNRKRYADYGAKFTALSGAGDIEVLDLVTITHTLPGWTTKQFLIMSRGEDEVGRMQFTVEAYYPGAYDDAQVGTQAGYESDLPNPYKVPAASTGISSAMTAVGTAYDFDAVRVSFTPPATDPFYSYSEIYASNDDSTYYYVGRDGTGMFTFNALGVIYEPGDTCYIKIRSVSTYGVPENLPAAASTSVLISSTMRLGGFYAGLTFFGDNAVANDAKILLDKTNTLIRVGPTSADYITIDGDYSGVPAIVTSNYVSGAAGAGLLLKSDLLEVGNIACRGIFRTNVFQKDTISIVGGNVLVMAGDVLDADMVANDEVALNRISEAGDTRISEAGDTRISEGHSSLTIEGNETFAIGDILRIKDGIGDEWLEVSIIANAPIYGVYRDKGTDYAANSNPAWTKGAAVVNYGQSGDGGIYMTASEPNAPYMSVITHAGSPWDTVTTHIRMGNLNGYAGYSSDVYGWAAYIDSNNYIKIDPTNGIRMSGDIIITGGSMPGLTLDDLANGASYGRVALTAISAGKIIVAGLDSGITDKMFQDLNTKNAVEAWRHASNVTMIDGGKIYANTITANAFISTLYGDLNQAMDYVKTVLGAGDEYEHDLTGTDLSNGSETNIDADTHADYGISVRISTATEWDDGGVWDTGTWDEPTDSSGNWTSASMDLGSSKTLQIALRYTAIEEVPASTTPTLEGIYSSDNVSWGTNAALDDNAWETLSQIQITGNIYKASGTLKTFRYFKIKITLATTVTTDRIILHTMTYLGNVINLFGQEVNKTIAAGGTNISLSGFNATPAITVTPIGATPLVPLITAQSSSSVTIKLYNLAGNAVGGNANITIIGV